MVKGKIAIRLKAAIIGGPYDGATATYEGSTDDENWQSHLTTLTTHGHQYTVVNYDRETNQAELKW